MKPEINGNAYNKIFCTKDSDCTSGTCNQQTHQCSEQKSTNNNECTTSSECKQGNTGYGFQCVNGKCSICDAGDTQCGGCLTQAASMYCGSTNCKANGKGGCVKRDFCLSNSDCSNGYTCNVETGSCYLPNVCSLIPDYNCYSIDIRLYTGWLGEIGEQLCKNIYNDYETMSAFALADPTGAVKENGTCVKSCPTNCESCSSSDNCTQCKIGYYLESGSCSKCPAFAVCTNGVSFSCQEGYSKSGSGCISCLTKYQVMSAVNNKVCGYESTGLSTDSKAICKKQIGTRFVCQSDYFYLQGLPDYKPYLSSTGGVNDKICDFCTSP